MLTSIQGWYPVVSFPVPPFWPFLHPEQLYKAVLQPSFQIWYTACSAQQLQTKCSHSGFYRFCVKVKGSIEYLERPAEAKEVMLSKHLPLKVSKANARKDKRKLKTITTRAPCHVTQAASQSPHWIHLQATSLRLIHPICTVTCIACRRETM